MAGDWIKMRVWLRRDPRVASMADFLATDRRFMDHITDPVRQSCNSSVYEHITRDITRAITVAALLEVWGVARERGDRDGDDLLLKHCDIGNLDAICSTPGFGDALEFVDWVTQESATDKKGRKVSYVRFPNFFAENESPEDRYKKQHSEAQARYRAKQKAESDTKNDVASDITSDITVTPREEKRREEEKEHVVAKAPGDYSPDGFNAFWAAWPSGGRKGGRSKCLVLWKRERLELQATVILLHIDSLKASPGWTKDGGQFIPAPISYLNKRSWDGADLCEQSARSFEGAI